MFPGRPSSSCTAGSVDLHRSQVKMIRVAPEVRPTHVKLEFAVGHVHEDVAYGRCEPLTRVGHLGERYGDHISDVADP